MNAEAVVYRACRQASVVAILTHGASDSIVRLQGAERPVGRVHTLPQALSLCPLLQPRSAHIDRVSKTVPFQKRCAITFVSRRVPSARHTTLCARQQRVELCHSDPAATNKVKGKDEMHNTHGASTSYKTTQRCSDQGERDTDHTLNAATQPTGDQRATAYKRPSILGSSATSIADRAVGISTLPNSLLHTTPPVHFKSAPVTAIGLVGVSEHTVGTYILQFDQ